MYVLPVRKGIFYRERLVRDVTINARPVVKNLSVKPVLTSTSCRGGSAFLVINRNALHVNLTKKIVSYLAMRAANNVMEMENVDFVITDTP